jgi:sucrose-6-phosphate hydrolase SacC (GH32 family)
MLLPQEQTLKQTSQGIRLFSKPVKEVEDLCERVLFKTGAPMTADEANALLAAFADNDQLRIKATLRLTYAVDAGLSYNGERLLTYDMNGNLLNGSFYSPDEPDSMLLHCDVYIDKSVVEGFIDDGAFSFSMKRDMNRNSHEGYRFWGRELFIETLEVYKVKGV